MQRFNRHRRTIPLTPLFLRLSVIFVALLVLFFIIRALINHSQLIQLRAEHAKELVQSKKTLIQRIDTLQDEVDSYSVKFSELQTLRQENEKLKTELGRGVEAKGVLAAVLTLPNRSFYDTIIIDAGKNQGVREGQIAYAFDNIAIGTIAAVADRTSTVLLFSAPNRETSGRAEGSDVAITLIGRGNGDFEVRMPRDVHFAVGDMVSYESVQTAFLAKIEKIITDPRDPFQRLLAKVPINLTTLKWVVVR